MSDGSVGQSIATFVPWVVNGGAVAMLVYVARLYWTGRMVSAPQQQLVKEIQDKRIEELWKINHDLHQAWLKSNETMHLQSQQISRLLELGRLSEALLRALNYSLDQPAGEIQDRGPVS